MTRIRLPSRVFYATRPLTTTKGELSNATLGFASILLKAIEEIKPQHIAAAFDLPQKTFRHERDATYKATRKPMPDELRPQFERCKELLGKMGVPIYALPGFEADDVIGALAKQAEAAGLESIIVSGDLDTLQLVTPHTKLFTTRMGFQNTVVYDEAQIDQRYGLRPDQMVDFKALKGDATDNIPGVTGVGARSRAGVSARCRDHGRRARGCCGGRTAAARGSVGRGARRCGRRTPSGAPRSRSRHWRRRLVRVDDLWSARADRGGPRRRD